MYEKEKEKRFQYELTKTQVDFEFFFTLAIALLAISYGLLSYYRDNPLGWWSSMILIFVLIILLGILYSAKERKFREIKKKHIESYWD